MCIIKSKGPGKVVEGERDATRWADIHASLTLCAWADDLGQVQVNLAQFSTPPFPSQIIRQYKGLKLREFLYLSS